MTSAPATATVQARCRAAAERRRIASAATAPAASTAADLADDVSISDENHSTPDDTHEGALHANIVIPPSSWPVRSGPPAGPAPRSIAPSPRRPDGRPPPSPATRRRTSATPAPAPTARPAPAAGSPGRRTSARPARCVRCPFCSRIRSIVRTAVFVGGSGSSVHDLRRRRLPHRVDHVHDLPLATAQRLLIPRPHRLSPLRNSHPPPTRSRHAKFLTHPRRCAKRVVPRIWRVAARPGRADLMSAPTIAAEPDGRRCGHVDGDRAFRLDWAASGEGGFDSLAPAVRGRSTLIGAARSPGRTT